MWSLQELDQLAALAYDHVDGVEVHPEDFEPEPAAGAPHGLNEEAEMLHTAPEEDV